MESGGESTSHKWNQTAKMSMSIHTHTPLSIGEMDPFPQYISEWPTNIQSLVIFLSIFQDSPQNQEAPFELENGVSIQTSCQSGM